MLLGGSIARRAPEVRRLVSELALESLSQRFGAIGVMLVRREFDDSMAAVSSRIPVAWTIQEPLGFEIAGRLWSALSAPDGHTQVVVGDTHVLLTRQSTGQPAAGQSVVAAAIARSTEFDPNEVHTIVRLLRSVAMALGEEALLPDTGSLRVLSREAESGYLADVRVSAAGSQRHAASVADTADRAVAQAAAELCDLALRVLFVGATTVNGSVVTIVVVDEPDGGPFFGLSVTETSSRSGAAEAVFAAAAVVDADPFAASRDSHATIGPPAPSS